MPRVVPRLFIIVCATGFCYLTCIDRLILLRAVIQICDLAEYRARALHGMTLWDNSLVIAAFESSSGRLWLYCVLCTGSTGNWLYWALDCGVKLRRCRRWDAHTNQSKAYGSIPYPAPSASWSIRRAIWKARSVLRARTVAGRLTRWWLCQLFHESPHKCVPLFVFSFFTTVIQSGNE